MSETELVAVEPKSVLAAFSSSNGLSEVLDSAVMEVRTFKHDMTTKTGRDKTRSLARKVASLKTTLDGMGKELVTEWKTKSKAVDANRKKMRDDLDELKVEARKPLTEFEAVEQERKDKILRVIEFMASLSLRDVSDGIPYTLEELNKNLDSLNNIAIDDSFEEFELSATKQKAKSIGLVEGFISVETERLEKDAELERLQAAEEARAQKERDDAIKEKAAEGARLEAQAIAREAADKIERERDNAIREKAEAEAATKQAERDKIAAEENAKIEAGAAAERARLTEVKRQEDEQKAAKAAQDKLEANKAHVGKIRGKAKDSLMKFVDEETAKKIVLAIHAGEIKNVTISY